MINRPVFSQVAINSDGSTPDPSAMLDIKSTDKGVLIPRIATTEMYTISSPAKGLMVYVTDDSCFYYYDGSAWEKVGHTAGQWTESGVNIYASNSGNVGINVTDPSEKLDIDGNILLRSNSGILHQQSPNNYLKFVGNNDTKISGDSFLRLQIGGIDKGYITSSQFNIHNELIADGNVGIGTTSPGAKLHVVGDIKIEDGNQGAGKVLVSDTNGLAGWADPNDAVAVPDTAQPIPIRYHGSYLYVYPQDNGTGLDWSQAESICASLDAFGYTDWYLPDLNELNAMYKQSYLITGLEEDNSYKYWSGTQSDSTNAFTLRLDYGGPDPDNISDTSGHSCRCIRK